MPAPISQMRVLLVSVLFAGAAAQAQEPGAIRILERRMLAIGHAAPVPAFLLRPTLAVVEGSGWEVARIEAAAREGARILAQCSIGMPQVELVRIGAPARFRDFYVPYARELAAALRLEKPTVYFIADTLQRPAFDAEAIGFGNSRNRPELLDSVWITRGARDLSIVLAHELVHVLIDSGEHSIAAYNLMNADTAPENTRLTRDQCERLIANASRSGLLRPAK